MSRYRQFAEPRAVFLLLVCALLVLSATTLRAEERPKSVEFLRGMVEAAQITFKRGEELFQEGRQEEGRLLFKQCRQLLLRADKMAGDGTQQRMDRVFNMFYQEMAAVDPRIAERSERIGKQVEDTFHKEAVYAGQVSYFIDYLLQNRRQLLVESFQRAYEYVPMIRKVFADEGLPPDLAYMALVESGFRHDPVSSAGAKGLWQFIPETARRFGLQVGNGVDERTDPVKSTRAAASYLKYLYQEFGDWPLAVAAYNCGEGRVSRALKRVNASSYWELVEKEALPQETRRYVPSIIAATMISRNLDKYGLAHVVRQSSRG